MKIVSAFILIFLSTLLSCDTEVEKNVMKSDLSKDVELVTDYGTIIMRLSDKTPKHRNNFIKLVNEKFYDSVSFHRIIESFLIQTGDYTTKPLHLQNDSLNLPYLIDSEFRPDLFHKRGALNAARMGDDVNPNRSSDGYQFTIIQGEIQTDSTLNKTLKRVNFWRAKNKVINRVEYKNDFKKYTKLSTIIENFDEGKTELTKEMETKTRLDLIKIKNKINSYNLDSIANIELKTIKKYSYPKAHREIYKTHGGSPHLDQNYTVFGEVVKGMNVVDSIAAVATDKKNKPLDKLYIISARMIERKQYK